jgi:hypothetical protein
MIEEIKADSKIVTDKNEIANKFNEYFINVGPQLASEIPPMTGSPIQFLHGSYCDSMAINETDSPEIVQIVSASIKD